MTYVPVSSSYDVSAFDDPPDKTGPVAGDARLGPAPDGRWCKLSGSNGNKALKKRRWISWFITNHDNDRFFMARSRSQNGWVMEWCIRESDKEDIGWPI